jgi:hypothetical protein
MCADALIIAHTDTHHFVRLLHHNLSKYWRFYFSLLANTLFLKNCICNVDSLQDCMWINAIIVILHCNYTASLKNEKSFFNLEIIYLILAIFYIQMFTKLTANCHWRNDSY